VLFDANGKRFALPLVVAISEIGVRTQRMRPDIATALVGAAMLSVLLVSNTRRCAAEQVCRSFSNADQVNHSPQKPELEKNCFSTPHPPMKPTSVLLLTATILTTTVPLHAQVQSPSPAASRLKEKAVAYLDLASNSKEPFRVFKPRSQKAKCRARVGVLLSLST
jgi:hypothetical protein